MEEVIDIGPSSHEPISLDFKSRDNAPSVNFGGGIELLMNDKKKSTNVANLDLGELDDLESELNQLSGNKSAPEENSGSNLFSGYLGLNSAQNIVKEDHQPVNDMKFDDLNEASLGAATSDMMGSAKTWDGFMKSNEVPPEQEYRASANLSEREKRRKKRLMLKKLDE